MQSKPEDYPFKGTLKTHQLRALREADQKFGHAWFMDPGAGKTAIAIAEASELYMRGQIDGMIITAPFGPHKQWITEQFPLWCDIPYQTIHNKQTNPQKKKFFESRRNGMGVMAINYEAVNTKPGEELLEQFMERYPRIYLVVDESQRIKNPRAASAQQVLVLSLKCRFRRLLTGTPLLKGLEDLWTQYEVVEPGLAWPPEPIKLNRGGKGLGNYPFLGYRTHYCITFTPKNQPQAVIIRGYRNEGELKARVKPHVTRVLSDEFMIGEKPTFSRISTPMNAKQQAEYNRMKDHLMAEMESGMITAQNALVQMGKLMQIGSGFLYHDKDAEDGGNQGWDVLGSNKVSATLDLLEQLDEPVMLWCPFRALQQTMMIEINDRNERNKWETRPVFTDVSHIDLWRKQPRGIVLANQAGAWGTGMNCQHSAANIYMAHLYSAEARWQSLKRTDRIGQERQVRVWDLTTPSSIDGRALDALEAMEELSRRNIDELRDLLL